MPGLLYPLRITSTGDVAIGYGDQLIQSHLRHFVETHLYERVLNPAFGFNVRHFDATSSLEAINESLRVGLRRAVPQIAIAVSSTFSNRKLNIRLEWVGLVGERESIVVEAPVL